jgi:hypothetical protein
MKKQADDHLHEYSGKTKTKTHPIGECCGYFQVCYWYVCGSELTNFG